VIAKNKLTNRSIGSNPGIASSSVSLPLLSVEFASPAAVTSHPV
jgi:hypothetical protein